MALIMRGVVDKNLDRAETLRYPRNCSTQRGYVAQVHMLVPHLMFFGRELSSKFSGLILRDVDKGNFAFLLCEVPDNRLPYAGSASSDQHYFVFQITVDSYHVGPHSRSFWGHQATTKAVPSSYAAKHLVLSTGVSRTADYRQSWSCVPGGSKSLYGRELRSPICWTSAQVQLPWRRQMSKIPKLGGCHCGRVRYTLLA